jgi:hypothetical protein
MAVAVTAVAVTAASMVFYDGCEIVGGVSNRQHVCAGHTLWFEKKKPGKLKNKRAYASVFPPLNSRKY